MGCKSAIALAGLLPLAGFASDKEKKLEHQVRPNIVVFLVDDMGWQDTSVPFWTQKTPFNQTYHTPNMERLASEGLKFTNAYATPVCSPTRISLLTGLNAAHHGVTNWISPRKNNNTDNTDDQFAPAPWRINGLNPEKNDEQAVYATPFPKLLNEAGYYTIHVGKAHWGSMGTPGANPYNMGFLVNISGHAAGHPQSYLGKENYGNIPGKSTVQAVPDLEEYYGSETFLTEALTQEAIKSLENPIRNKQPFFLNLAHYAVHTPIMADKRFVQKYLDAGLDSAEAKYASLIEGMDKSLGDIMDFLKTKNVEKNTVVIFMSDNGGLSLVRPRGGIQHTQNAPLKAGKGSVHEGGIREPMIVKWPGVVKPNSKSDQYIIVEDFFPSILQMAGINRAQTKQIVDGKSFVPILVNPDYSDSSRLLIWHYPNKWIERDGPGINYFSAVRKGSFKLVYNLRNDKKELYNLKNDIGEQNDISGRFPQIAKELSTALSAKLQEWHSPMPFVKSTGKPVEISTEFQ
jgi:arylsulfatase A-like enzyme